MMIFLENILQSPCHGRLVFAPEGQYSDSRHPGSENRLLLFKSRPVIARTFFHSCNATGYLLCESQYAGHKAHKDGKATGFRLKRLTLEVDGITDIHRQPRFIED